MIFLFTFSDTHIVEKDKFVDDILEDLNYLPPKLTPLTVTIILIDDLSALVKRTWDDIESVLVNKLIEE